ncbi:MAG: UDP-N-acetylglucosamine 1-carboxyvinyltransferase [Microgenomates bacterium OLB23]|nr:MAG: UDP-N-acetylglucosamine 1-carboxyvinyltransferase [Microgenomates bacterium OLB23]
MSTEDAFVIKGGVPLRGEVQLDGAKNVALKVIVAALLLDSPITFKNIPHLSDIDEQLHLMRELGAKAEFVHDHDVYVDSQSLNSYEVDLLHGSKIRTSFMLFAPLLYRFGKAIIPNPGGCRLGARPIDRHVKLLETFGVHISYDSSTGYYTATLKHTRLQGAEYTFEKPSHTGTELGLMIAAIANGQSTIHNAAQEPEVDDMIRFLNDAGARIRRQGTSIIVDGVDKLAPTAESFTIMADRLNAAAFGVFAVATKGDITVKGLDAHYITDFTEKLIEAGGGFDAEKDALHFYYKGPLKSTDITTVPHPGFNTDTQGPWAILMTQAHGVSTIHETVFENRFGYVDELRKLGAHIEFFQPQVDNPRELYQFTIHSDDEIANLQQAIRITGPSPLHNGVLHATDIRAGASLVIAACAAEGESVILGASHIDRGYEKIEVQLAALGAQIKRV